SFSGSSRSAKNAISAGATLDSAFQKTSGPLVGDAGVIDRSDHRVQLHLQSTGHAGNGGMGLGASVPVSRAARPSARLAPFSSSRWPIHHAGQGVRFWWKRNTHHLHGAGSSVQLGFRVRRNLVMDSKSEKIALFRYGLIATLVLEKLPRGELTRRALELSRLDYEIP